MDVQKILIIEDDRTTAQIFKISLEQQLFKTSICHDMLSAKQALIDLMPDLCIIDLNLPDGNGGELLQYIIENYPHIATIIASIRSESLDKISTLELGADDYLVKPVNPQELGIRIRNILKHRYSSIKKNQNYHLHPFKFYPDTLSIHDTNDQMLFSLTKAEMLILQTLCQNTGNAVSKEDLINIISRYENLTQTRSVDSIVCRLRKKFKKYTSDKVIHTVYGVGYTV